MNHFSFDIISESPDSKARVGIIHTPHGDIETPTFTVVGTKATVKALTVDMVRDLGTQAVLANTYHLYLEPGDERIRNAGGFSKFMNWNGPTLTDSGGFQVFSLGEAFGKRVSKVATEIPTEVEEKTPEQREAQLAKIDEEGVTFRSHIDGAYHRFTPERSMEIQWNLGADIIFAFDECTSPLAPKEYQKSALDRTHRWLDRCIARHEELDPQNVQALYAVVQGGMYKDLREESASFMASRNVDGFGIGGSFTKKDLETAVGWVTDVLPKEKPRHLLGIGEPIDLFLGIEQGIDTFDCVAPTRIARNGTAYTKNGKLNIQRAELRDDMNPLDPGCGCMVCQQYTRSYLAHLHRSGEILSHILLSYHNVYFIVNLVKKIRETLLSGTYEGYKTEFLNSFYRN